MSDTQELLNYPPGPDAAETERLTPQFVNEPLDFFVDMKRRYGPVFTFDIAGQKTLFLNNPASVEQVLRSDFSSFGMSRQTEEANRPLLGRSMPVVADHDYWAQLHGIMLPMFTPKMIRHYFEQTVQVVAEEVEHLAEHAERCDTIELWKFIRQGIFVALSRTLFVRGVQPDDIPMLLGWFEKSNVYMGRRYLQGPSADTNMEPPIVEGREALASLDRYLYNLVNYRRNNLVDEPEDMLDVLISAHKPDGSRLSDVELRDNVMALFFGGQDTTPAVTAWAFGLLSAHPDKRERLFAEVDEVLGGRRPTLQDLPKLVYCEHVLDEALRLYPPFSFIGRQALQDTSVSGYRVDKGTSLAFVGWTIQRDEQDWPDPETFDPDRHDKSLRQQRSPCAMVAFGYGQRRCIGERVGRIEGMLMLAMFSQRFLFDRVGGGMSEPRVAMSIKPADSLPVAVRKRPGVSA